MTGTFELLEHTADVGVRAQGSTLAEAFEQATLGLLDILGIWRPGAGNVATEIRLDAGDAGGLLVNWLSEVLYLHDTRDALVSGVSIDEISDTAVSGSVRLAPRRDEVVEGTQVKAITYHRLRVEPAGGGWIAEVYVDV